MSKKKQRSLDEPTDTPAPAREQPADDVPFEAALDELEKVVKDLEDGTLPLEEAMKRFERGLALVKICQAKLERAELRVKELLESGETKDVQPGPAKTS